MADTTAHRHDHRTAAVAAAGSADDARSAAASSGIQKLIVGALGVVYGDIGTSPLYTLRQSLTAAGADRPIDPSHILGVLSLIFWALFIVVTVKYVVFVMRADNRGEGGILALTALAQRPSRIGPRGKWLIAALGIAGAALFYGDGIITPAVSVLSAVEGLKVATPVFEPYIVPVTIAILAALFLIQRRGTERVGAFFGPVMIVWFVVLGLLGVVEIVRNPHVLLALNPLYGLRTLTGGGWHGFLMLGGVVLAVTGAEALYADMGHFGRFPIRAAWFGLVLPALVLNYFGQGSNLLLHPEAIENPFFHLAPGWALYPMVILATAATVIASQAVISGAFSMTRQAVQLRYMPLVEIRHTSPEEIGQIYVPRINMLLLIGVVGLVLGFESSDRLASAYGIAVTGTMTITTALAYVYMRHCAGWGRVAAGAVFGLFAVVDLAFLGANLVKVHEGGWFPLAVGAVVFTLMSTWRKGREVVRARLLDDALPLAAFLARLPERRLPQVPGTAVYLTQSLGKVPRALLHNLKHNKVLHARVVLLKVQVEDEAWVAFSRRVEIRHLEQGFHTVLVRYGFAEQPDIPAALARCAAEGFPFDMMDTSFFIGRAAVIASSRPDLGPIREQIFIWLFRNSGDYADFLNIPPNRAVELGTQIEV